MKSGTVLSILVVAVTHTGLVRAQPPGGEPPVEPPDTPQVPDLPPPTDPKTPVPPDETPGPRRDAGPEPAGAGAIDPGLRHRGAEPLSAADVRDAPLPGAESGRVDVIDHGDGPGRRIGRGLLWIPRIPVEVVFQPVRGALYLKDRYNVVDIITGIFTTEDKKLAIFPTALAETGFGLNVGVRASYKDVFGTGVKVKARVGFGGAFRRVAAIELGTGTLLGKRIEGNLEAHYENRDKERFYGYGNGDEVEPLPMPVDPTMVDTAIASRYQVTIARVVPRLKIALPQHFRATATGAYIHKQLSVQEVVARDARIDEAFAIDRIPGFLSGTEFIYTEAELAWDTRRLGHEYDPAGMRTTGGLVAAYVGRQDELGDGPTFYRIGVDLQRILRLTSGPRIIELRAHGEMVTGDRDDLPFTELPRLGGRYVLRGYQIDRFRDKIAAVAQAAYKFGLSRYLAASAFVDVGRVFSSLDEVSLEDPRVGFGGALEVYSATNMVVRLEVASSIDGGVFAYLSLDPVFDARARVERR